MADAFRRQHRVTDSILLGRCRTAEEFSRREDEKARKMGKGRCAGCSLMVRDLFFKVTRNHFPVNLGLQVTGAVGAV